MVSEKAWYGPIEQVDEFRWEIPQTYREGMNTTGRVYADEKLMASIRQDQSLEQVVNVAHLPGIVGASMAMPDIHHGYGFPIGGVAAFDLDRGVISPGGVGFDINCGVSLFRTNIDAESLGGGLISDPLNRILDQIVEQIPCGLGSAVSVGLGEKELRDVLEVGAHWAHKQDVELVESRGRIDGANPDKVSDKAKKRGLGQLGTLGSGNHFIEIGVVDEVFDASASKVLGLEKGTVTFMIHSGSRGLGHQVCGDYVTKLMKVDCGVKLPDKGLCCAPLGSEGGKDYMAAMACAANYGFANRAMMGVGLRKVVKKVLGGREADNVRLVYDVAHNIAKIEKHFVEGKETQVCVHRKGATRAFGVGHPEVPKVYRDIGQPVLIPGDMGRYSYVAVGANSSETFGSVCHGAGRALSRTVAKKTIKPMAVFKDMIDRKIILRSKSRAEDLVEEASQAYKDVDDVIGVVEGAGLARKVVKLRPLGVVKG